MSCTKDHPLDEEAYDDCVAEYMKKIRTEREAILKKVGGVPVEFDCERAGLDPQDWCSGCAYRGPQYCYQTTLSEVMHEQCEKRAHLLATKRNGEMCFDCAFRKGSPEHKWGDLEGFVRSEIPFRCHQGMPLSAKGEEPTLDYGGYYPRSPSKYPVCAGWLRAKEKARKMRRKGVC